MNVNCVFLWNMGMQNKIPIFAFSPTYLCMFDFSFSTINKRSEYIAQEQGAKKLIYQKTEIKANCCVQVWQSWDEIMQPGMNMTEKEARANHLAKGRDS